MVLNKSVTFIYNSFLDKLQSLSHRHCEALDWVERLGNNKYMSRMKLAASKSYTAIATRLACLACCMLACLDGAGMPAYRKAAELILKKVPVPHRGYCLVFGAGEGRLACEIAAKSSYILVGAEQDADKLARGRSILHKAGLYGTRITLQQNSLSRLRYRDYAAALVVADSVIADGVCRGKASEFFRMIRPDGGMGIIGQPPGCAASLERHALEKWLKAGNVPYRIVENEHEGLWAIIERSALNDAGQWTHVRGDAANTASSGDARTTDAYKVLWFGLPGPAVMVDRHWKAMPPLYTGGRMFTPAFDRIICSDAYNGARLWELDVPGAARIVMLRDAGWIAAARDCLYVAKENQCLKVAAGNGQVAHVFHTPDKSGHWGYVAVYEDMLYGSTQPKGASYLASETGGGRSGNRLARGDRRNMITSTGLFALNRHTGKRLWHYAPESAVIINVTICAAGNGIFFFESTSPEAVSDKDGRTQLSDLIKDDGMQLVRLDRHTGKAVWHRRHEMACDHVLFLSHAGNVLVASGTADGAPLSYRYHLSGFSVDTGQRLWTRQFDRDATRRKPGRDWSHGKQDKHPVVVGDMVYYTEGSFDVHTGRPRGLPFNATTCADYAASANHIFGRGQGGACSFWNIQKGGDGAPLSSAMRPGCYVSMIPAGGIVLMPSCAGCMCNYTLQTSIAWLPDRATKPGDEKSPVEGGRE